MRGGLAMLLVLCAAASGQQAELRVENTERGGLTVPLEVTLPDWAVGSDASGRPELTLTRGSEAVSVAWQRTARNPGSIVFQHRAEEAPATRYLLRRVPAGDQTRPADSTIPWSITDRDDGVVEVRLGERSVLGYCFGPQLPEGVAEDRRRACYVHPLHAPDGRNVLDDFPADHLHHRGISWMWPRVIVRGESHDLWTLYGIEARFEEWIARHTGPLVAELGVRVGWYVGAERVVAETLWLRVHPPLPESSGRPGFFVDFDLTWEAVTESVELGGQLDQGKGYGGFGARFAPGGEVRLVSSRGHEPQDTLHVRYDWVDYSAALRDGPTAGLTILRHPGNPGHPPEWILRHYGYLGVSWPGLETFTLEPGVPLRCRYRVLVHEGAADEAMLAAAWRWFSGPELSFAPTGS